MEFADEIPLPAVGIDLGTTYSRVAVWKQGRVEIVPNDHGSRTTPSCVAFTPTGRLIGDAAKYQADVDPSNSIFDVKRLIGRSFDDEALLNDKKFWPFKIIGKEKKPKIVVTYKGEERPFAPEEITAMILCKMVEFAEDYLGTIVRDVVVTVPACFNNIQRQATKDAGTIAGVNVMHIINEPTAAAIAHCLHRESKGRKNVLVFDLGGGTFDASLIVTVEKTLQVKSVSGNAHLGGRDFDNRMIKMLVTEFQRKQGKNIRENSRAIEMLRAACERAKRTLSSEMSVDIEIDHLLEGIDFSSTITRAQFEKMNMDLFEECINLTDKCLKDAEMDRNDINEIVLVGGSSRIPMVQQLLQAFFCGKELCNSINPDEAVAYGAATQAAVLRGTYYPRNLLVYISTYSLWVNSDTYTSAVIPRHTPIPGTLSAIPYEQLNPNLLAFQVFEGERPKVGDNVSLGVFTLHGIPPEDVLKRNFCFDIDADGILKCSSNDLETGYKNEIPVEHPSGHWQLSREEVCKLIMATEIFKREDEWQRQSAKARISLENYLQTISGMVKYHGNKIQHEDRKELTDAILQCQKFIQSYGLFAKARRYQEKLDDLKKVCDPFFTFSNGDGAD